MKAKYADNANNSYSAGGVDERMHQYCTNALLMALNCPALNYQVDLCVDR